LSIRLPLLGWVFLGPLLLVFMLVFWIIKLVALGIVALVHYIQRKRCERALAKYERLQQPEELRPTGNTETTA
jgi:hypothetical protein